MIKPHQSNGMIHPITIGKQNQNNKNTEANQNGMMMGRIDLNSIDITFSSQFFDSFVSKQKNFNFQTVLDCGAGIGRISENILRQRFTKIDMVQKCPHFVEKARQNQKKNNYRHYYCSGLEQFTFQHRYNCIWVQWVLTHLPDSHIVSFLKKAKQNLQTNGVIIVKQNYSKNKPLVDKEDSSITRSLIQWKSLFYDSKLLIMKEQQQPDWPSDLYPVKIWALS